MKRIAAHILGFWLILFSVDAQTMPGAGVPLPPLRPPTDEFRQWLTMSPARRVEALAGRKENRRKVLLAKLEEYEKLAEAERERRLRLVELRWYLTALMHLPKEQRSIQMASVPKEWHAFLDQRMKQWDTVPAETQVQILESESVISQLVPTSQAGAALVQPAKTAAAPSPLDQRLTKWQAMSPAQKERLHFEFNRFFDLSAAAQQKVLHEISPVEKAEMERTLASFNGLPPQQRRICVNSFSQFATMSSTERRDFLRNVERWKTMTPSERTLWRDLVHIMPPIGPDITLPPMPPVPVGQARK